MPKRHQNLAICVKCTSAVSQSLKQFFFPKGDSVYFVSVITSLTRQLISNYIFYEGNSCCSQLQACVLRRYQLHSATAFTSLQVSLVYILRDAVSLEIVSKTSNLIINFLITILTIKIYFNQLLYLPATSFRVFEHRPESE